MATSAVLPAFDPRDPDTWGVVLTITQVSAIYQRTVPALRKALGKGRVFTPRPYKQHPYRWRREDVLRDVSGGATQTIRRSPRAAASASRTPTDQSNSAAMHGHEA